MGPNFPRDWIQTSSYSKEWFYISCKWGHESHADNLLQGKPGVSNSNNCRGKQVSDEWVSGLKGQQLLVSTDFSHMEQQTCGVNIGNTKALCMWKKTFEGWMANGGVGSRSVLSNIVTEPHVTA